MKETRSLYSKKHNRPNGIVLTSQIIKNKTSQFAGFTNNINTLDKNKIDMSIRKVRKYQKTKGDKHMHYVQLFSTSSIEYDSKDMLNVKCNVLCFEKRNSNYIFHSMLKLNLEMPKNDFDILEDIDIESYEDILSKSFKENQ